MTKQKPNINTLYRRLATLFADIFEHPDCGEQVRDILSEAQMEIINHSRVQNDISMARCLFADAMTELTERDGAEFPNEIAVS